MKTAFVAIIFGVALATAGCGPTSEERYATAQSIHEGELKELERLTAEKKSLDAGWEETLRSAAAVAVYEKESGRIDAILKGEDPPKSAENGKSGVDPATMERLRLQHDDYEKKAAELDERIRAQESRVAEARDLVDKLKP